MAPWELLKQERFAEAIAAFSAQLKERQSTGVFNNRGMAYLHLRDYESALKDFRSADAFSSAELGTQCDGHMCGVALWMGGHQGEAVQTWSAGVDARLQGKVAYGDAAGGVTIGNLLLFAGILLHDRETRAHATRFLRKRLRTKQSLAWPGPTSRFLLGDLSETDMTARVSTVDILRERQMCQARFYVGVRALSAGDDLAYCRCIHEAVEFGRVAKLESEYYLALYEDRQASSSHGIEGV